MLRTISLRELVARYAVRTFSSILGEDYGNRLQWGAGTKVFHRPSQSGGLGRHKNFLTRANWLWVDPSEAPALFGRW